MRGREGGGEGREGTGQVMQGPVDHGEDLGYYHREVGPWRAVGRGRGGGGA